MKKKLNFLPPLLITLALAFGITGLYYAPHRATLAENMPVELASSAHFTDQEIKDAADAVIHHFKKTFDDCQMQALRYGYQESFPGSENDNWAEDYGKEEGMVFFTEFTTNKDLPNSSTFSPGSTYEYHWYVARSGNGHWTIVNGGQG